MSESRISTIESEWKGIYSEIRKGEFMRIILEGGLTREMYVGFLKETYHNTTWNPRLGSLFQAHLGSRRPALEARFLKHNASELGHNDLALADLRVLGEDPEAVKSGRPSPETEALVAFTAFQIQHRNPLSYLGYLYHLESLAIHQGQESMGMLERLGIPANAASFLLEHADADVAHMQFNRDYVEGFVESDSDLEAVIWGMRGAGKLHALMFQAIVDGTRKEAVGWKPIKPAVTNRA